MVAPGKNLEFEDLPRFALRCAKVPGLREKIIKEIQNRPGSGEIVFGPIKRIEVQIGGLDFVAYFGRRHNKIGLAVVFKKGTEKGPQLDYELELKQRYHERRMP